MVPLDELIPDKKEKLWASLFFRGPNSSDEAVLCSQGAIEEWESLFGNNFVEALSSLEKLALSDWFVNEKEFRTQCEESSGDAVFGIAFAGDGRFVLLEFNPKSEGGDVVCHPIERQSGGFRVKGGDVFKSIDALAQAKLLDGLAVPRNCALGRSFGQQQAFRFSSLFYLRGAMISLIEVRRRDLPPSVKDPGKLFYWLTVENHPSNKVERLSFVSMHENGREFAEGSLQFDKQRGTFKRKTDPETNTLENVAPTEIPSATLAAIQSFIDKSE